MNLGDPKPDLKAGQLSMDRAQIIAISRTDIEELFKVLRRDSPYKDAGIDVGHLTDIDFLMWYRVMNYKKGSITKEDLVQYDKDVKHSDSTSRKALLFNIANKLHGFWLQDVLEDIRQEGK